MNSYDFKHIDLVQPYLAYNLVPIILTFDLYYPLEVAFLAKPFTTVKCEFKPEYPIRRHKNDSIKENYFPPPKTIAALLSVTMAFSFALKKH